MNMWTAIMVLGIVAITSIARVLRAKYQAPLGIVEDRHGNQSRILGFDNPTEKAAMQRELAELRDRIKVLERIATEERHSRQIANEIEALRDT